MTNEMYGAPANQVEKAHAIASQKQRLAGREPQFPAGHASQG